jgi:Baculovirus FP protein
MCKNRRKSVVIADFGSNSSLNGTNIAATGVQETERMEIETINSTLKSVQAAQEILSTAIANLSAVVSSFNTKMKEIEERLTKCDALEADNIALKHRVGALETTVSQLARRQYSKTVEIKGIPISENEDVLETVEQLAKKLSCDINVQDLENVYRVEKSDILLVSFVSKMKQRKFLSAGRSNTRNLIGNGNNIYINEAVSKKAKFLLKIGRDFKRAKKLHWIGTNEGEVFCRKELNGIKHKISDETDFDKII